MTIFAKIIRLLDSTVANRLQVMARDIEALAAQRDEMAAALKEAREEISDLKKSLETMHGQLHKQALDIEFLSLSHKLADNPQALAEARTTVKSMLGKVQKAIALLKDDARI